MSDEVIDALYDEYSELANQKDEEESWLNCFGDPAYYGMSDFDNE